MLSPEALLAAEPRQPVCLGSQYRRECRGFPWRGLYHWGKEAAASPLSGNPCNPLLVGGKLSLFSMCQAAGFLGPGQPWCLDVRSPASPASCPVSLCTWLCLREASLMRWQLLHVLLGWALSDSTFDVGHCSHKIHPRNMGQG